MAANFGKKLIITCLIGLALLIGLAAESYAEDIALAVNLNRDRIGLDERAILTVQIHGAPRDLEAPNLPTLPKFQVFSQGTSSNYQIRNGVVSSSVTYRYTLLPKEAGVFPITNISVVYENKRYKGNEVILTVIKDNSVSENSTEERARTSAGQARTAFLEAEVDNMNPYVNQQVTLTLKYYLASARNSTPSLTQPTTTGFWIESLGNSTNYRQQINGRTYKVYEIKSALFPTRTGELEIGRAMMTTTVARDYFMFGGEQLSVRSKELKLKVKPLPENGRPADFTGSVGRYKMSVAADKTTVGVNQPIALMVRINGTGNIKSIAEPIIPETNDFRIYLASSKQSGTRANNRLGGTKIFEEIFVPRRPGNLVIPSLKFNYFDPSTGRYKEISSKEIPITVTGGGDYVAGDENNYTPTGVTVGNKASDIRFLMEDMGELVKPGYLVIFSPLYLVVNGLPVLLLIGMLLFRFKQERFSTDVGQARSRAAIKLARKRLTRAKAFATEEGGSEFFAEISQAINSYLADKLNISPHGLTIQKVAQLLKAQGAQPELIDRTVDLLKRADFARYTPGGVGEVGRQEYLKEAEELMVALGGVKFA